MARANNLPNSDVRIRTSDLKSLHVLAYDDDNCYPQRMNNLKNSSRSAKAAVNLYAKFIRGGGFIDKEFFKLVCNDKGETADDILSRASDDLALYRGICIHFNYNIKLQKTEVLHVPFENARKSKSEIPKYQNKIALSDNWYRDSPTKKAIKLEDIDFIDKYDPSPEAIQNQIINAGGIENYQGQCLYFSLDHEKYPEASVDIVIKEMETEAASSKTTFNNLKNNFSDKTVFTVGTPFETEKERGDMVATMGTFIGVDGMPLMLFEGSTDENGNVIAPKIEKIPNSLNDKVFQYSDEKTARGIIRSFGQPGILHTDTNTSALGRDDIEAAAAYYNKFTEDERIKVESLFGIMFDNFIGLTVREDMFLIAKYSYYEAKDGALINTIGIGGTSALQAILLDQALSINQKRQILVIVFGISMEDAIKMTTTETEEETV